MEKILEKSGKFVRQCGNHVNDFTIFFFEDEGQNFHIVSMNLWHVFNGRKVAPCDIVADICSTGTNQETFMVDIYCCLLCDSNVILACGFDRNGK